MQNHSCATWNLYSFRILSKPPVDQKVRVVYCSDIQMSEQYEVSRSGDTWARSNSMAFMDVIPCHIHSIWVATSFKVKHLPHSLSCGGKPVTVNLGTKIVFVSKSTKSKRKKILYNCTTFLSHFILCFSVVVLGLFFMSVFRAIPFYHVIYISVLRSWVSTVCRCFWGPLCGQGQDSWGIANCLCYCVLLRAGCSLPCGASSMRPEKVRIMAVTQFQNE